MKIIQFASFFPPHKGGLQIVAENISKYLVKGKYCEVINITSSIGQEEIIKRSDLLQVLYKNISIGYEINGYKVIVIPSFEIIHNFPILKFWSKKFWTIIQYIKSQKPDIIQTHTRFFLQTFFGGLISKRLKKPRIHIEHGSGFVTGIAKRKEIIARIYDETLGRLIFKSCDKIISINKTNLNFIQKFVSGNKCETIYNGIEIPNISKAEKKKGDNISLVFVGRLISLKGVNILIDACKNIVDKGIVNFSLDIIGDGEEKANLQNQVKKNKLEKYINFLGAKNHDEIIQNILPSKDIFVNPSFQEGLPTTVIEGLLAGCVVVATSVGGTKEISEMKDLILLKPGDSKLLAEKIDYAMKNYIMLKGKSESFVKEKFNWEKSIERYAEVYKEVIEK